MDPIEENFTAMHVESAFYSRLEARAPWGIDFSASRLVRFGLVVTGSAWLKRDDSKGALALVAGDCFMVNSYTSFQILDNPKSILSPCETVFANSEFESLYFIRGDGEATDIIVGRFSFDEERDAPLISILPDIIYIPGNYVHANLLQATLQLIDTETRDKKLGNKLVIRRLADILFIQAVRVYFATHTSHQGWIAAWRDPNLKKALQALHQDLAYNWQVSNLAKIAGMSRAAFALHFKVTVGSSPIEYLTQWRLYRAKCLLGHPELSLSQVATQIGYDTDSAFNRAFKREMGITPGKFRKNHYDLKR